MLTLTLCLLDQELGDQIIKCLLYLEPAADLLFTIPQFHNMFYWQQCSHFVNNPCPYCGPHWESGFGRQLTYNHVQICLRSPDMISRSLELPFCRAATDHGGESGSSRLIWWGEALSVRASLWGRGETGNADSTRAHSHSLCSCLFPSLPSFYLRGRNNIGAGEKVWLEHHLSLSSLITWADLSVLSEKQQRRVLSAATVLTTEKVWSELTDGCPAAAPLLLHTGGRGEEVGAR